MSRADVCVRARASRFARDDSDPLNALTCGANLPALRAQHPVVTLAGLGQCEYPSRIRLRSRNGDGHPDGRYGGPRRRDRGARIARVLPRIWRFRAQFPGNCWGEVPANAPPRSPTCPTSGNRSSPSRHRDSVSSTRYPHTGRLPGAGCRARVDHSLTGERCLGGPARPIGHLPAAGHHAGWYTDQKERAGVSDAPR